LAALGLLAAASVYVLSERALRRSWDMPRAAFGAPTDAAAIAEGRRLAMIRGCANGCHGKPGIAGAVFDNDRWYGRLVAPNLSEVVRRYSDAKLARRRPSLLLRERRKARCIRGQAHRGCRRGRAVRGGTMSRRVAR
jgi:hypothetical protein